MGIKKFDKELYERADPLTNGIMMRWLERNDYEFINPEDTYGVDIICSKDGIPAFFETEIAYIWKDEWPNAWMFIHIPYRKKKIVDKWVRNGLQGTLTFVQFKKNCKQAWFIDGQVVRDAPIKIIDTKYTTNEKFFNIDINDAHMVTMKDSDIKESRSDQITNAFINVRYPA